jgi:hypothetical protein
MQFICFHDKYSSVSCMMRFSAAAKRYHFSFVIFMFDLSIFVSKSVDRKRQVLSSIVDVMGWCIVGIF